MLILTRKVGESIIIGDQIEIILAELNNNAVRIGINAPKELAIYRKEVYERIMKENQKAAKATIEIPALDKLNLLLSKKKIGG